jgi:colanic acid/amylovoran biosynthesis glycosyltransferase
MYLDATLIALQPDLIHFEFGALAPPRMYLKDLLNTRIIVSFRGYDLNFVGLEHPQHYQQVWDRADALHLLGHDLWQRAQRRGCPADKHHALIPPAIDTTFFEPGHSAYSNNSGTPDDPVHILSVGRLEWKKGYEYALQAIRCLQQQGIHCRYDIIGSGSYLEALAFARWQLEVEPSVHFPGAHPRTEVREYMRNADIFLHAAVSEGFGNAVLEAQSMSLPVVCTDADGLRENVADGSSGFVVPRRDAAALAEKLVLLIKDPCLRWHMGTTGREQVVAHFRLDAQIAAFDQLYRDVLNNATTN